MADKKKILAVSLMLNVALAGVVAVQLVRQHEPAAQSIATPVAVPVAQVRAVTATEQEKTLSLATLEADARAVTPPPRPEFWKAGDDASMAAYQQKVDQQLDGVRRALISRYGAGAADDPLFVRVFKPLNARYPYLSSKSQLALARLQRTNRPRAVATGGSPISPDPAMAFQTEQEFNSVVQGVISPAEYDEYLLHESIAARQLRASSVAGNEREFRAAFEALREMDADRSAAGYVAGQDKLREILGPMRYTQFSASRDPQFAVIENAVAKHQLARERVLAVYGVMLDAQVELVRAASGQGTGAARSALDPQQVFAQRDRKIVSLVGDDIAREVIQAYSNSAITASVRTPQSR